MVPNVNQITSKLATLNDQQLQQYAQMHQDDAYVLALAVSEKNRRAALRSSAQTQQAPQGTVAEQEVAEMAPAGISTLEAPALDELGMAGGGVVGYQAGGNLGRLATREELEAAYEEWQSKKAPWYLPEPKANMEAELAERRYEDLLSGKARIGAPVTPAEAANNRTALNQADAGLRSLPAAANAPTVAPAPDKLPAADRTGGAPRPEPDQRALETVGVGAGRAPVTGGAPAQTPEQPAELGGLAGLRQMMGTNSKEVAALQERQQANTKAYYDGLAADAAAEQAEFKERTKDQDKTFDEKRERISERQAELDKERKQARAFAIIRAGLAMMSGESPYALVNIGRGAQEGLNQFAIDTQRIDKAREGLREELDKIAELQMQMRLATGEKLSQLKKEESKLKREGEFKAVELATAAGLKNAREQGKVLWSGVVGATIKEITADADFKRDMQKLAYQRSTSLQQARISAGGRSGSPDATRMKEIADLQAKVYDVLLKNPLFLSLPPEQQKKTFDQQMQMLLEGNAGLGEGMFLTAPANGAQVRRSSAMAQ